MDSPSMTTTPNASLPAQISKWIRDEGGHHALLLISTDAYLRPHVIMLARDEIFVISDTALRIAVGGSTRSAENLRARASATLAIYDEDLACTIKARVVAGPRKLPAGAAAFDLAIEEVRRDTPTAAESSARLVSGLRFEGRAERPDIQTALRTLGE